MRSTTVAITLASAVAVVDSSTLMLASSERTATGRFSIRHVLFLINLVACSTTFWDSDSCGDSRLRTGREMLVPDMQLGPQPGSVDRLVVIAGYDEPELAAIGC